MGTARPPRMYTRDPAATGEGLAISRNFIALAPGTIVPPMTPMTSPYSLSRQVPMAPSVGAAEMLTRMPAPGKTFFPSIETLVMTRLPSGAVSRYIAVSPTLQESTAARFSFAAFVGPALSTAQSCLRFQEMSWSVSNCEPSEYLSRSFVAPSMFSKAVTIQSGSMRNPDAERNLCPLLSAASTVTADCTARS